MNSLTSLHDGTLLGLDVAWAEGTLRLNVLTSTGNCAVVAEGLSSLTCRRNHPWGPSKSINRAWTEETATAKRLLVEMQSGDLIEATVTSMELNAGGK